MSAGSAARMTTEEEWRDWALVLRVMRTLSACWARRAWRRCSDFSLRTQAMKRVNGRAPASLLGAASIRLVRMAVPRLPVHAA